MVTQQTLVHRKKSPCHSPGSQVKRLALSAFVLTSSGVVVVAGSSRNSQAPAAFASGPSLQTPTTCGFVASAWLGDTSQSLKRHPLTFLHSTTEKESREQRESSVSSADADADDADDADPPPPAIRADLSDYGKTSIDIDRHRLENTEKIQTWRRRDLHGQTLIDQTMSELEKDAEFQQVKARLERLGAKQMSAEERSKRRRALDSLGVPSFQQFLAEKMNHEDNEKRSAGAHPNEQREPQGAKEVRLHRSKPKVLQINIGLYCNQACTHCHVESSPLRTKEQMSSQTAARCLELLKNTPSIATLDITGGAPELNDNFRFLVRMARSLRPDDLDIIDRCNLTVLHEPGQEDLIPFLKQHGVHVIASLPCYSADNVNTQRGNGVFERSISALLALNEVGYGVPRTGLQLDLVYNPLGGFLPPPQKQLESKYKEELEENFGVVFNRLFTMTNMPVKRFADFLYRRGELKDYMDLLVRNFNIDTMKSLMCLDTISVGWDGKIYDCDFNQQLGYGIGADDIHEGGKTVFDIASLDELQSECITNDNHCFGCTAGMGSS